ncbi:cytochrome P450 [Colletotrichum tofieldiae]|uniref:Cytochrome P450 n=1 Tax=Colletotrichum tofieldiae TaxID=708197 RepID=A0A166VM12_9PEZI|nr:cytochrome P450 [Colletotrichum tofieldiae]GKT60203.1 cytochrome P450 [Colletotrichum tofieldiae]GKT67913.1 cytochrome P450 [Colletotrichum tofieldiae]GKT91117.1 cytochrome P450 [Colletotrichum tofieldiae]
MILSWILTTALGACAAAAQDTTEPQAPKLTYLYTLTALLNSSIEIGTGIYSDRKAIPIIGGSFSGPRLSGTVLDLGADWGLTDSKGVFHPDTRYNLRTDDGANIYIQTSGSKQSNGKIYLRQVFETGSEDYYWLNNVVSVGVLTSGNGSVTIEGWVLDL